VHALAQRCPGRQAGIGDIRRALGIGRNLLIEVLEYFDRTGFTTRIGNSRRVRCRPDTLYGP
jgi:selenocysteine-specific elongation factor